MPRASLFRRWSSLATVLLALCAAGRAAAGGDPGFAFTRPVQDQLSLAGEVRVELSVPGIASAGTLAVTIDNIPIGDELAPVDGGVSGLINGVGIGEHVLRAVVEVNRDGLDSTLDDAVRFEAIALQNPDECEVLNDAECLLPYPSSRFLEPADTPTGFRLRLPAVGMPMQRGVRLSPDPYAVLDGFSPTVQILMHFPDGVDPVASNASRLLEETRTYDLRSLDADSPTILIDAASGEHILHFIENDARAATNRARQVLFLRPGRSLLPGHRYIVAVRNLSSPSGNPVQPEAPFAALRDDRPTDIEAIESRRAAFADIFARLASAGVERDDLILAFDFTVQSDEGLTGEMLSMRDQSFAWLDAAAEADQQTFTVDRVVENDCSLPGSFAWRQIEGTYQVPLFLSEEPDPNQAAVGFLTLDENGTPAANGFSDAEYTIALPCTVLVPVVGDCNENQRVEIPELITGVRMALGQSAGTACAAFDVDDDERVDIDEVVHGVADSLHGAGAPKGAAVLGHGLFMTGREFVPLVAAALGPLSRFQGLEPIDLIGGGTDWRGLSGRDVAFIAAVFEDLNRIAALPDRLRQGQLNSLVLGRMMKRGTFNRDPAFQTPSGIGVFAAEQAEMYYYGISLGGIMGLMHAALSPDVAASLIDEGSINFSILLQRSTQASLFEAAFITTGITDPMHAALMIGLMHELWVRGESAGYATHITENLLPETSAKRILMTVAWLDQQVTNHGSEITARTLGLPNLVPGSLVEGMPLIEDRGGPLPSAYVVYDTGTFQLGMPGPFIPSLTNEIPEQNRCDPHGERRPTIPAALKQIEVLFHPEGQVDNFCDGACDADGTFELPLGGRCDPFG